MKRTRTERSGEEEEEEGTSAGRRSNKKRRGRRAQRDESSSSSEEEDTGVRAVRRAALGRKPPPELALDVEVQHAAEAEGEDILVLVALILLIALMVLMLMMMVMVMIVNGVTLFADIQEWAREEEEEAQTYDDWRTMERYAPSAKRDTIYLLPLGINVVGLEPDRKPEEKDEDDDKRRSKKRRRKTEEEEEESEHKVEFDEVHPAAPTIPQLAEFVSAFFHGLKVKVMRPLSFIKEEGTLHILSLPYLFPIKTKRSKTFGNERLYDMDILRVIKEMLPKDGFCIVAITARDIYEHPRADDEIILGRGTGDRVGVISLYHHGKPQSKSHAQRTRSKRAENYSTQEQSMWKLRTCKTMAHEMCHIFGIDHCVYYTCLMNANASPDGEDTAEAMHLCPIDLRKLQECIGFEIRERYRHLLGYYTRENWEHEKEWMARRLAQLEARETKRTGKMMKEEEA